jgi:hypothetical protein
MSTTTIENQLTEDRRRIARLQAFAQSGLVAERGSSATSTHSTRRRQPPLPRCAGAQTRSWRSSGS